LDAAPARETAKAAVASGPALNFDRSSDLYKLATDSINQSDPLALYNGWLATSACVSVQNTRSQHEQLAASDRSRRALAAQELLRRCNGFFNNDRAANSGLLKRFADRLAADKTRYFSGVTPGDMSQAHVDAMLAAQDWQTLLAMQYQLLPGARASLGIQAGSAQEMLLALAWLQAGCDLGRDCSDRSIMYIARCADSGRCPGSIEAAFSEGLASAQSEEVQQFRKRIVQAFLARDGRFFRVANGP